MLPKDEYLPIGSVVLLKDGIKKAMIIGIMHTSKVGDEYVEYDYIAVLYPEGFITTKTMFMFNHNQITDVVHRGYDNPERADFMTRLEKNVNMASEDLQNKVKEMLDKKEKAEAQAASKQETPDDIF